ncbi:dTDP-4-dehydrorhamnose reductase [Cetobacterium ceti]
MILITGANGQLGSDFKRIFNEKNIEYIGTDYKELDITDISKVEEFLKNKNINLIINCAAYNNVDKAEEEKDLCYRLNAYSPRDLALLAKKIGAEYITYSTDFVFDGKKKSPYKEEDEVNPLSVYSQSKALGERLVLEGYDKAFVIRTSWVFGMGNNNFNKQVINWSKGKDSLTIVDDQVSSPTYSYDLALYTLKLLETKKYGLYHLSNSGVASKYDQGKYVLDSIGWKGTLNRGKSSDFNLLAKRAEYSKLDSSKLENLIGEKLPTWESGIDRFLKEMREKGEI